MTFWRRNQQKRTSRSTVPDIPHFPPAPLTTPRPAFSDGYRIRNCERWWMSKNYMRLQIWNTLYAQHVESSLDPATDLVRMAHDIVDGLYKPTGPPASHE